MLTQMKSKILDELLNELEDNEGSKLKPKAVEVSIASIKPGMGMKDEMEPDEGEMGTAIGPGEEDDKDDDEEELKQLLEHYLAGK